MATVQNLETTYGVGEEVTSLKDNVQNVGEGVEGANNKLDVILHGAHLVFIRSSIPFSLVFGSLISNTGSNELTGNRQRKVVVGWLSPPDLSTNFENATDAHHESTGEWLTQGSVFKSWKQSGSLLWIYGKRTFYNPAHSPLLTELHVYSGIRKNCSLVRHP
jgi:hypothetical protein